jgi:hypothetical protein
VPSISVTGRPVSSLMKAIVTSYIYSIETVLKIGEKKRKFKPKPSARSIKEKPPFE